MRQLAAPIRSRRLGGRETLAVRRACKRPVDDEYSRAMETPRRVLVIDDDEAIRSAFARVLTREGYAVQVAATAEDGLNQVKQTRPDAMLLAWKIPLINGVGFLYRLRENTE